MIHLSEAVPLPAGVRQVLILTDETAGPSREFLDRIAPDRRTTFPLPGGDQPIALFSVSRERLDTRHDEPAAVFSGDVAVYSIDTVDSAAPGDRADVFIDWEISAATRSRERRFSIQVLALNRRAAAQVDGIGWPVERWRPGDRVLSWFPLEISEDAAQGPYSLELSMYELATLERAPVESSLDRQEGALVVGSMQISPSEAYFAGLTIISASFGNGISLVGHSLQVAPDERLDVDLAWETATPVDEDLTVFVHVVDANDRVVTQSDGYPANGVFPTSLWRPEEPVLDRHSIELPATDDLSVLVGLYRGATGERIQLVGGGDFVRIGAIPEP